MNKLPAQVGLIGHPVEHSLSPAMQNAAFEQLDLPFHYTLLPTPPTALGDRIRRCIQEGFAGWNVTVPHKQEMLSYLDAMSDEVRATGACNTVRLEAGRLLGFNTDVHGFLMGLAEAGGIASGSKAVILGAGGAARAVAWALALSGCEVHILSRRPEQASSLAESLSDRLKTRGDSSPAVETAGNSYEVRYADYPRQSPQGDFACVARGFIRPASVFTQFLRAGTGSLFRHGTLDAPTLSAALDGAGLLVNCTPSGMWPHEDATPLPDGVRLPSGLLVYDLVYRPRPTQLLRQAAIAGCRMQDGLSMLVHQGATAFEIWTGRTAPVDIMRQACLDALEDRKQVTEV